MHREELGAIGDEQGSTSDTEEVSVRIGLSWAQDADTQLFLRCPARTRGSLTASAKLTPGQSDMFTVQASYISASYRDHDTTLLINVPTHVLVEQYITISINFT